MSQTRFTIITWTMKYGLRHNANKLVTRHSSSRYLQGFTLVQESGQWLKTAEGEHTYHPHVCQNFPTAHIPPTCMSELPDCTHTTHRNTRTSFDMPPTFIPQLNTHIAHMHLSTFYWTKHPCINHNIIPKSIIDTGQSIIVISSSLTIDNLL